MTFELSRKSEWFALDSPVGEPQIQWNTSHVYYIERMVKPDSDTIWFGQSTNWVKKLNEGWTKLTTDESVKPIDGKNGVYPAERTYFAPCEEPIYETLYKQLNG